VIDHTGETIDVQQEQWLVCAVAGMGTARDLAMDRRYAALQLDPTAAIAVRCDNFKDACVLPAGGTSCSSLALHLAALCFKPSRLQRGLQDLQDVSFLVSDHLIAMQVFLHPCHCTWAVRPREMLLSTNACPS